MKHLKFLSCIMLFSFILVTGCKKETISDNQLTLDETSSSAASQAKLKSLLASMPDGFEKGLKPNITNLLSQHREYNDLVLGVITPTACNSSTPLRNWLIAERADWTDEIRYYANATAMTALPANDAYLFENSSANQYFGANREYTQRIPKAFKDLKRFWNIQSDDIVLTAMHGNMLRDKAKLLRTYKYAFGLTDELAEVYSEFVLTLLDAFPAYRNGNHPIFTFNAYAVNEFFYPPVGNIPNKIIMGDGIMQAYKGIGFDDVAPQAILAHEFGHHIQFKLDLFEDVNSPEATRRTELMADAYSAYFLSHARGAAMQWKRVKQFLEVFFNIGDCSFTSNGHHGTPTQRMAAAEWAYNLANDAQKQGHILTSEEFTALFEDQLPILITK